LLGQNPSGLLAFHQDLLLYATVSFDLFEMPLDC
jgi:hypothetical protein